jgi:putative ubiquitin-RnfH superfamily antitoxin RatB of RatAB toxin-antitoxin module
MAPPSDASRIGAARLSVTVVYGSGPGRVDEAVLTLAPGATVQDALVASGLLARQPALVDPAFETGVWGNRCERSRPLASGDRVEVYRPLQVDPKAARRLRHRRLVAARKAVPGGKGA